ncbi:MAG: hypothetical protein HRO68_10420 [Nitrosopumilus sp.]|nr:hypothetical protein [Nitrosopumilus sp.]
MEKEEVEIFTDTIKEQLLGPGSDVFFGKKETEIIADFPLKRYYTGILYPDKTLATQGEKDTEIVDESEMTNIENELENQLDLADDNTENSKEGDCKYFCVTARIKYNPSSALQTQY